MRKRSLPTRRPEDRGASAIEYAGLIVLAALILGALVAIGIPTKVGAGVERAICTILHEQNCGKQPAAAPGRTRQTGAVPRFADGALHGLAAIPAPPADVRDHLPIQASLPINPAAPEPTPEPTPSTSNNRGGDQSSWHNLAVAATARRIQEVMGQYVTNGNVTTDCEPGGTTANCIPGGHKSGNGENGRADIILTGKDKKTGKKVIYIWEVKPNTAEGRREASTQLPRYVEQKQKQVGSGTEVKYGFYVPDSRNIPIPGNGNTTLDSWSLKRPTEAWQRGLRLYASRKREPSETPTAQASPQTQSTPQQQPVDPLCNDQPPTALQAKKDCIAIPGWNPAPRGNPKPQASDEPEPEQPEPEPEPVPVEPEPEPILVPTL